MSHWTDDDNLLEELRAAHTAAQAVSKKARDAARAAFTWRTVDQELEELMTLCHDSSLDDQALVRSAARTAEPRVLSFQGSRFSLEAELMGGTLLGQVVPARGCRVSVRSADGRTVTGDADASGFFSIPDVPQGSVRFEVLDGRGRHATEWVLL